VEVDRRAEAIEMTEIVLGRSAAAGLFDLVWGVE
jgi:hypothetical protein